MVQAQLKDAAIAGKFPAHVGDNWGLLLARNSPLTACVSKAVETLQTSGTLNKISKQWFPQAASVPELK